MKTSLIVALLLLIAFSPLWSQQRKITVQYTEGGKQVVKEYTGAELDKLLAKNKKAIQAHSRRSNLNASAPKGRQIVIQEGNKKPIVYTGAKLDALLARNAVAPVSPAIPTNQHSVIATKMPDGSVKIVRDGVESISK